MDAVLFGRYFLEFALLYPGAYLCLAPLRDHLKAPKNDLLDRGRCPHGAVHWVCSTVHDL